MKLGEFFVALGVDADTPTVREFGKAIADLPVSVAGAIVALAGIQYELGRVAAEAMGAAVAFQMFGSQTGLSWRELQQWQIVAEQANVSAESVASSVSGLQRNLAEIRLGRGDISSFQILGISPNQNAFEVLDRLRERLKGLDRATATNLITRMGLSPDMIQVLQTSDAEFKRITSTIHGMTTQQEKDFLTAKRALVELGQEARYLGFGVVAHLIEGFEALSGKIGHFKEVAIAVGLATAAAFAPLTATVVGLLLLLDDLAVNAAGGKSLSGLAMAQMDKKLGQKPGTLRVGAGAAVDTLPLLPEMIRAMFGGKPAGNTGPVVNQSNHIEVHSNDPEATGAAIHRHLKKQASDASLQLNNQGPR